MTTLLLFGAGASYGSFGLKKTPPLGKDLFTQLCKYYPESWGNTIPKDITELFNTDFELGMDALHNEHGDSGLTYNVITLLKQMAIYFSNFEINKQKENLYCRLFRKFYKRIVNNDVILSSLNYECLVELALSINRINYNYGDSVDTPMVLKPHGSCNFIPQNFIGDSNSFTINSSKGFTINTSIKPVPPNNVQKELKNVPIPPCMSLFTRDKHNIISPNHIKTVRDKLKNQILKANKIVSVGVKPNPLDFHIWDPIKESTAKIFLIANKDECTNWMSTHRKDGVYFLGEKFDSSFKDLCKVI